MTISVSSPVTGQAITGLTSPTYTVVSDVAPSVNAKQYAVTALGGTQTGVDAHSVSKPFTHTFFRPAVLKTLPQPNVATGVIKNIPVNTYKSITRKGAVPSANQNAVVPRITTTFEIPAGTDTYEPEELRAMLSLHIGMLTQQANNIADLITSGVL